MSMYEIEALIENTVRVIDRSNEPDHEKRNLIWNAYTIQNSFDCSFTNFRVIDILLNVNYVQTYNVQDFPLYKEHKDFFDQLNAKNFEWINKVPNEKWSDDNESVAYWDKKSNKIYVDYNSDFYTLFPNEKSNEIAPLDFGLLIIEKSNLQKDKANIYDWTAFMILYLLGWFPSEKTVEELKQNYFIPIKNILHHYNYDDYTPLHRGMDLKVKNDWISDIQKELLEFIKEK
ncbi:hypothetical protein [Aquimarina algicola]|uniref:Uncharacterized protein n=1 Tax=Aquimarina algicola TaxID=2589995 RepID=A0A504J9J8_9FLAO|nr:hypothetical protein [Aquimarina algicola]TPN85192.1 hypothetical protein FHK87_14280 [Aquimarina algicola]